MYAQKYILYARKSSEDKNRQVTSIEDQIIELTRLAASKGIVIVETIKEARSAKKPGRDGFNAMLAKMHSGEADGILCWKLDRLSRNALDGGQISWMLQNGIIRHIMTIGSDYRPSDNVLMMAVELGMATQYVKDLKTNVKRGTRQKAERGWFPAAVLPIGYKHNPLYQSNESNEEIVPDPTSFPIVKRLWELLLTGVYTVSDLKREADLLGLVNKKGKPYSLNTFHLLFAKEFYAGFFHWRDEENQPTRHHGKHAPMISLKEFLKAQKVLGNYSIATRERTYDFTYRGLIYCGECKGRITAEHIHQIICTNCKFKFSIKSESVCKRCNTHISEMKQASEVIKDYYRCMRKNGKCTQRSIEEKTIEGYISSHLKEITVGKKFYKWAIETIDRMDDDLRKENSLLPKLLKKKVFLEKQLDGFMNMRSMNEIDSNVFNEKSKLIKSELSELELKILANEDKRIDWKKTALRRLEIARHGSQEFKRMSAKDKKVIVSEIGSNLILRDKKLQFIRVRAFAYIKNKEREYLKKIKGFQPGNNVENKKDLKDFMPLTPSRLAE